MRERHLNYVRIKWYMKNQKADPKPAAKLKKQKKKKKKTIDKVL